MSGNDLYQSTCLQMEYQIFNFSRVEILTTTPWLVQAYTSSSGNVYRGAYYALGPAAHCPRHLNVITNGISYELGVTSTCYIGKNIFFRY